MGGAFEAPPGSAWTAVSPRLRAMRRTIVFSTVLVAGGLLTGLLWSTSRDGSIAAGAATVVALAWTWWMIGRNWRSWGYAERVDDLLVTHGALFRTLVVVPYGRMQLVDVVAGPIERIFGLVNVKLHTAAATTDARIRGLRPDDAGLLRDRLATLGEAHAAGL
jgi:membrane protein YdbS with pleckstrin-like domain